MRHGEILVLRLKRWLPSSRIHFFDSNVLVAMEPPCLEALERMVWWSSMVAKIALLRGFNVKRSACSQFPACREFLSLVIKRKLKYYWSCHSLQSRLRYSKSSNILCWGHCMPPASSTTWGDKDPSVSSWQVMWWEMQGDQCERKGSLKLEVLQNHFIMCWRVLHFMRVHRCKLL